MEKYYKRIRRAIESSEMELVKEQRVINILIEFQNKAYYEAKRRTINLAKSKIEDLNSTNFGQLLPSMDY